MIIEIDTYLKIKKAKKNSYADLIEKLTFKNPDYYRALRLISQGAIGREALPSKKIRCFIQKNNELWIPRGTGKLARNIAKENNELVKIVDNRTIGHQIDFNLPFRGNFKQFEIYQSQMITDIKKTLFGTYVCPTGGGKTLVALGLIAKIKKSTIVIVDKRDLLVQWIAELKEKCTGKFTIGQYGCGKKKWGDVTVAMTQTLRNLKNVKEIKKKFGIMFIEECHKSSAPTFIIAGTLFSSKYQIGLSATPKRKDQKEFIYQQYIGPIRMTISDDLVMQQGRILPVKSIIHDSGYELDYETIGEDITFYSLENLTDDNRNMRIIYEVEKDLKNGYIPIVFSNRVQHCKFLYHELKNKGYKVGLIIGAIKGEDRDRYKELMKDGYLDILVANVSICGTGLDIPILSSAHVTFFTSNELMLKQISGRIRRKFGEQNHALIHYYKDFVYTSFRNKETMKEAKIEHLTFKRAYNSVKRYFKKWNFENVSLAD